VLPRSKTVILKTQHWRPSPAGSLALQTYRHACIFLEIVRRPSGGLMTAPSRDTGRSKRTKLWDPHKHNRGWPKTHTQKTKNKKTQHHTRALTETKNQQTPRGQKKKKHIKKKKKTQQTTTTNQRPNLTTKKNFTTHDPKPQKQATLHHKKHTRPTNIKKKEKTKIQKTNKNKTN